MIFFKVMGGVFILKKAGSFKSRSVIFQYGPGVITCIERGLNMLLLKYMQYCTEFYNSVRHETSQ